MGGAPSTVLQLALLVIVVLPGVTYQLLRERQKGPSPGERDLSERILRAIAASVALNSLYAVVLGPELAHLFKGEGDLNGLLDHLRLTGLLLLVLVFVIPAGAAWGVSCIERRALRGTYIGTPTAWDHIFRDCPPSFIRVRLKDGVWVGGWYGGQSFATSYPHPPEIFLELEWKLDTNGNFLERVERTQGVHLRRDDIDILEILEN
ncbi:DUF6338 family protein [Streptomyces sp. CdTB01]|uniref:DUF6338 family protein n=1 Tax=Streptomyces sp. CdTB01 TaxID=1725411 RepID=UPI00073A5D02|nr:DUF6338 family protein [Streptomyces sp. CdTB01]ALV34804.1 hypothetical protein AS200_24175 [Streptomyces sp. CdTB01]